MVILKKVTVQYVRNEDRIRMTAEPDNNPPVVFWLTLRMSRLLVKSLCDHLERTTPTQPVIDRDMSLTCRQRDAEWQLQPSAPVLHTNATSNFVPDRIDVSFSPKSAAIAFPLGISERAEMNMSPQELRQWLSLLFRMFREADWPLDIWPKWFTASEPAKN